MFFIILFLIVFGIFLILFEFLITVFFLGFLGFISVISGIILSYQNYGNTVGNYTVLSVFILFFIGIFVILKNKFWLKIGLETKIKSKVNVIEKEEININDIGITVGTLNPIGKVLIKNKFFEGKSIDGFIDTGKKVIIIEILKNQILVKLKK
ncbi:MAG: hypothetical protein B6I24_08980 [Bacteroidetes bacterium 4572_128]|nr:MAG: hypothetical protein B6I24_08980 [Bacteroidetes bacterium 4572_128]